MATLARINLFPIKSLEGVSTPEANIVSPGALEGDRELVCLDRQGDWINGKRTPRVHRLRAVYDLALGEVALRDELTGAEGRFSLDVDLPRLAAWLSQSFELPVTMQQNLFGGFPDDTESPGPTVVSTATLARIGQWFDLPVDEVRARFRANLEIDGVEPFWEDRLVAPVGRDVRFTIGDIAFEGTNPCQRCPVPSRDSHSGEPIDNFASRFNRRRREELPDWACRERFDHFYRLSVNTRILPSSWNRFLRVGDPVEIIGAL